MSSSGLVHNDSLIFDGTNYNDWRNRMLDYFRDIDPYIEQILDMGFSPLEDEENSYLDDGASKVIFKSLSNAVALSISPYRNGHELWTKLQDNYGVSMDSENDCSHSTSGRNEFSTSSTSPTCGKPQNNAMVSRDKFCNNDSELLLDNISSLSHCNDLSLDLNTSSTINVSHACVDSPSISSKNYLYKSNDDEENYDEDKDNSFDLLMNKSGMVERALQNDKNSHDSFIEFITTFVGNKQELDDLEAREDESLRRERGYANTIADLKEALEEEQTTKKSLEETFTLELSKVNETHDRALKVANDFKIKNDELVVEIVRLLEANKKFEKDVNSLEDSLAHLTKSHDQLQAQLLKELPTCSPIAINVDACATNSISCEASI